MNRKAHVACNFNCFIETEALMAERLDIQEPSTFWGKQHNNFY